MLDCIHDVNNMVGESNVMNSNINHSSEMRKSAQHIAPQYIKKGIGMLAFNIYKKELELEYNNNNDDNDNLGDKGESKQVLNESTEFHLNLLVQPILIRLTPFNFKLDPDKASTL
uniref:Uncharacterized protein n=1 Tax=Salix viminalis TaxID=40686 RepID=A0A6N2MCX4_SALVM